MKKEDILEHLRAAKTAHIKWVQRAKLLINGVNIEKESIPVDYTECKFGKWFYSDAQMLNALSNNPLECMETIEKLHSKLHDTYLKIFNIYFNKPEGLFAKIFNLKKKKITQQEHEFAQEYYNQLENISHELLNEINRLERRIVATPQEKLDELI